FRIFTLSLRFSLQNPLNSSSFFEPNTTPHLLTPPPATSPPASPRRPDLHLVPPTSPAAVSLPADFRQQPRTPLLSSPRRPSNSDPAAFPFRRTTPSSLPPNPPTTTAANRSSYSFDPTSSLSSSSSTRTNLSHSSFFDFLSLS
ncbi:hypothetical protein LINPERPRIM_LOCUS35519, partial [Linum perenne]